MDRRVGILFMMIVAIAPLGLALDPAQEITTITENALDLLINEDLQQTVPASLPQLSIDRSEPMSIPRAQVHMNNPQSSIDELFENITYASFDIENPEVESGPKYHSTRDDQNLDLMSKYFAHAENDRIASTDISNEIGTNIKYLYKSAINKNVFNTQSIEMQQDISSNLRNIYSEDESGDRIRIANEGNAIGNYYYEKKSNQEMILPLSNANNDVNMNFDYIYSNHRSAPQEKDSAIIAEITAPNPAPSMNNQIPKQFIDILPNLNYLCEKSTIETAQTQSASVSHIEASTDFNIDRLIMENADETILPYLALGQRDLMNSAKDKNLGQLVGMDNTLDNYAVVVGIDNYTDRSSLHTSVNDAETMTALLESYGYNVVKLTDNTDDRPTKSNILEKALGEMKYKKDLGKVLIYFSGHGEKKGNNYYLIPQDGNGQTSSYISTQELEKSIHGLKSVVLVVDACNAGGMDSAIDDGQMILASSKEDQPSNEMWFGSLSLFTYNLCNAIREEDKTSREVILERCFYKAKEATERGASWRFLAQTPEIKDKTEGYFSLK